MIGPEIKIFHSIEEIPQKIWQEIEPLDFPFARHEFLRALERHQCLGARTGWNPTYLTYWQGAQLSGAFICFVKSNSYGEYIFDFQWAQAFQIHKKPYYPKLTSAIPFTPATGPKLLGNPETFPQLIKAAQSLLKDLELSGLHALFIPSEEFKFYQNAGLFLRHSFQYHWQNEGYRNFEDFLGNLRSKRRKEILRERSQALSSGLKIRRFTGNELRPEQALMMHRFYLDTVQKMGGFDYLTKGFFLEAFETLKDQILLVVAENAEGKMVAGALNYFGSKTLFGRHWGCLEDYKSLHFEICYYQGIEFAIEKGFKLFEAGAQGEHKFQRGFLPRLTYSAHQICDERMGPALENFVEMEKLQIQQVLSDYEQSTPFSRA